MFNYIKKSDIMLLLLIIVIGVASMIIVSRAKEGSGLVVIEKSGKLYGKYSLNQDIRIPLDVDGEHNLIIIKDGEVKMQESNCQGQDCVRIGSISQSGQSIVCLPHRLLVKITDSRGGYDAITE